ncbi:MAG: hypothetical protein AB7P34_10950 [Vicinamibacterales bacterium]
MSRFSRRVVAGFSLLVMLFTLSMSTVPVRANQLTSKLSLAPTTVGEEDVLDVLHDAMYEAMLGGLGGTVGGLAVSTGAGAILGGLGGFAGGFVIGVLVHYFGDPSEYTGLPERSKMPQLAFD